MVKPSILFCFFLGVAFVLPSSLGCGADTSGEKEKKIEEKIDVESPALTCLIFKDLGCNTECSIASSAFSLKGTGKCTDENICECTIEQFDSLDGLFRAKFNAEDALTRIKKDKDLAAKVLEILQVPFQTVVQIERQIREITYGAIYSQLRIIDNTPAWKLGLVGETDKLYYDKIKAYVSEQLKPVLASFTEQLTSVDYKSNMKKSLEGNTDDDLQSIINEVRCTKNKNLNDIVDDYLKSAKITEEKDFEGEDIADAIGYQIIDQFINHIEQNRKPVATKLSRKPPKKNSKKAARKSQTNSKKSKSTSKSLTKKRNPSQN